MKAVAIALFIWVLVVPCAVALFLIFTFIASLIPTLYFAAVSLALALLISIWGPLSFFPSRPSSSLSAPTATRPNLSQENNHENCLKP